MTDPAGLPNRWHVLNLQESPYFQGTLGGFGHVYPLSLFVGRAEEARQLLTTIGSARSTRQGIGGSPGIGKTTLVQSVKAGAISAGYWAANELVPFYETDSTDHVLGRILSSIYDTILSARPMVTDHPAMQAAQQLVKVARLSSGGGSISVMGIGGGISKGATPVTPTDAMLFDGPRIIRDLLALVREAGSPGIVLHLNNMENLTERAIDRAADILRSLRDPVLLLDGLHVILVGTATAVLAATGAHPQVRSVFTTPLTLQPLPIRDVQAMLEARYRHLALAGREPLAPIAPAAVAALYPLFHGDLRSLLACLEEGARLLIGVTTPGLSISLEDLRPALQQRYEALLRDRLDERRHTQLEKWGRTGAASEHTQKSLASLWKLSQPAVSNALVDLEAEGYVFALPRQGRAPVGYVLSGVSRLIFG